MNSLLWSAAAKDTKLLCLNHRLQRKGWIILCRRSKRSICRNLVQFLYTEQIQRHRLQQVLKFRHQDYSGLYFPAELDFNSPLTTAPYKSLSTYPSLSLFISAMETDSSIENRSVKKEKKKSKKSDSYSEEFVFDDSEEKSKKEEEKEKKRKVIEEEEDRSDVSSGEEKSRKKVKKMKVEEEVKEENPNAFRSR
nr:PREDICTED: DNA ligase 1-like [Daucus carota subsp. sativus]